MIFSENSQKTLNKLFEGDNSVFLPEWCHNAAANTIKEKIVMSILLSNRLGNSDRPVEKMEADEFSIRPYTEGLAEFIKDCETPMTVAVQGDWGCGKTSMMNMIRDYLKKDDSIIDVWFNTWQFSQFNMDKTLNITFLQHLINQLSERISDPQAKKGIKGKLIPIMKSILVNTTKQFLGDNAGEVVNQVADELTVSEKADTVTEIIELKNTFTELIKTVTRDSGKRVVIFIDDLDRLQPVYAVELLEILKLFIDCEDCVYVMAIDTSVVFQGIREKYGHDMSDAKAQSFFDKMIQLPFKMPVAYYKMDGMMVRLLDFFRDDKIISERERGHYLKMMRYTTDGNPRSVKRLVNSMLLLDKVAKKKNMYGEEPSEDKSLAVRILFLLSCLQHKFPNVYDFIVNNLSETFVTKLKNVHIYEKTAKRADNIYSELVSIGMPEFELTDKQAFSDITYSLIDVIRSAFDKYDCGIDTVTKIMNIMSLNNLDFTYGENAATEQPPEQSVESTMEEATVSPGSDNGNVDLIGMILDGDPEGAVEKAAKKGIYLPVNLNSLYICALTERSATLPKQDFWEEYERRHSQLENLPLFHYLDKKIRDFFDKAQEDGKEFKYTKYFDSKDNFYVSMGVTMSSLEIRIMFNRDLAKVPAGAEFNKFIDKMRKRYKSLQDTYGKVLFDDTNYNLNALSVDDGRSTVSLYLFDERSADIVADFICLCALNPDLHIVKE